MEVERLSDSYPTMGTRSFCELSQPCMSVHGTKDQLSSITKSRPPWMRTTSSAIGQFMRHLRGLFSGTKVSK